jgi:hypothetical protein
MEQTSKFSTILMHLHFKLSKVNKNKSLPSKPGLKLWLF